MAMTWLELTQAIVDELALGPTPTVVIGSLDAQTRQIGALLNRCGDLVARAKEGGWTTLQTEFPITVAAPLTLTGNVTLGSAVIMGLSHTTGIEAGTFAVQGQNLTQATRVASVDSATQVTVTQPATGTASGVSFTFAKDTYAKPADMQGPINRTMWDRTRRWELVGPMSPQEDQWVRSGIVATGPRRRFRFLGRGDNTFRIWPPPTAIDAPAELVFEYQSAYWAQDGGGTPKPRFTADTDTCVFDDDVMVQGGKWLFMQAKGFDYTAQMADWQAVLNAAMGLDGAAKTLNMARNRWPILIGPGNVRDTDFGV